MDHGGGAAVAHGPDGTGPHASRLPTCARPRDPGRAVAGGAGRCPGRFVDTASRGLGRAERARGDSRRPPGANGGGPVIPGGAGSSAPWGSPRGRSTRRTPARGTVSSAWRPARSGRPAARGTPGGGRWRMAAPLAGANRCV